ncbi:hypothetical protein ACJ41O_006851 [Fusarium nematophilum]
MVTPTCYSPAEVRRYGSRMGGYSYPERRPSAYPIHPDARAPIMAERDAIDDVTPQRKRIAVAVASTETHMKQESFSYNLESSRQYQARGTSVVPPLPSTTASYPDGLPAYANEPIVYRPAPTFAYSTKPYYPAMPAWGHGYAEDQGINYAMYPPSYHAMHDSDYGISYRIGSGTVSKSGGVCVDTEPNYAYSSGTNATAALVHRSAPVSGDSTSLTFQSMAAGVNMGDRVLPMPLGRPVPGQTAAASSPSYRNDSGSSIYSGGAGGSSSSRSSQASNSTMGTSPATASPDSEAPSGYTSYEPSSVPPGLPSSMTPSSSTALSSSMTPTVPSYPPPMASTLASHLSRTSSSNDLYAPAGSSDATLFSPADPMRAAAGAGSGPDMTYRYTDTTTAAATAAATTTARREPPITTLSSHGTGAFPLGHQSATATTYMPQSHGQAVSYMLATSDVGGTGGESPTDNYRKTAGGLRA